MMEEQHYTLSILTENKSGLLNHITIIFTRRKINIESLNVSTTEVKGLSRFTVVIRSTRAQVDKVCEQIRKLIDVLGAFVYDDHQIFYQEIALYKIEADAFSNRSDLDAFVNENGARVLEENEHHILIEKTGKKQDTHALYEKLEKHGLLEFARSGRVALSKSMRKTEAYIKELENSKSNELSIKNY